MSKNSNEPAFARPGDEGVYDMKAQEGLTKREYIAARALQGLLASGESHAGAADITPGGWRWKGLSLLAVKYADDLLEALEEKQK